MNARLETTPWQEGRAASLDALAQRVAYDLACLDYPTFDWLPPAFDDAGLPVLDVLIVGAGQSGLAAAWALRRKRVAAVRIVDAAPAGREGPWATYARMDTLRTPKYITAMDGGFASLSFRAWYDASGLAPPWDEIERAPRLVWMAYLGWFRKVLSIPVENETGLLGFEPLANGHLRVRLRHASGEQETVTTRKLVLATGLEGGGRHDGPFHLAAGLPREVWAHAYHDIDFDRLRGQRVAVLGIGSAAADNAHAALRAGSARVDLFARRKHIDELEARGWVENTGFLQAFADLDDDLRWRFSHRRIGVSSPAPVWSIDKCKAYGQCSFHLGVHWRGLSWTGDEILIDTSQGEHRADFVVFGTGASVDLALRPELAAHAAHIALWRDVYLPGPHERCEASLGYPYLGQGFELRPRVEGSAGYLANVHLFNQASAVSMGVGAASVTGLGFATERLATALVRDLYRSVAHGHIGRSPWPLLGAGYD